MWDEVNENLDNKNSVAPEWASVEQKDNFDDAKKEAEEAQAQAEVKESSDTLHENIVDSATATQEAKSDSYVAQQETQATIDLQTYEWYTKALQGLITEIKELKKIANKNKKRVNKSWQQTLDTAISKLNQYRDIIEGKQKSIEDEFKIRSRFNRKNPDTSPSEVSISNAEIDELKNTRFRWNQQVRYDIKQWQDWKSSNTAPWPNQSLEQVRLWNRIDTDHNKNDAKLNEALQNAAFLRIIDNNQDAAREILQWIASNSLSDQQIVVIQSNMTQLAPYFEQYWMRDQVYRCIQTRGWRYNESYQNYWNMDVKTAYKTGWITGWLNSLLMKTFPNAKPEQVSNFTNIAVAAGWIYAIYKIWKWFFGKNEEWKRNLLWKAAWLAGIYFWPQLLLWQDGFSLLWDILSWKADFGELKYRASNCLRFLNHSDPEIYEQMAPWILWMSIFPQTYTVAHVRVLQQSFSDQNAWQQRYSATYNRLNKDNSALANEFKNTFNENQYNENERKAFLAKLWITDNTKNDTIIFNEASKLTDKKTSFELWMKSQGKKRNPEFKKQIDDYLKENGDFNPETLDKNRFIDDNDAKYTMREKDIEDKESLKDKIDNLSLDSQKKSNLKVAMERFYDERTIASKPNTDDFDLKMEGDSLILKSNWWHESQIKLNTQELVWFGSWLNFTDLADLLNTADLANKILETQKDKIPTSFPAFQYKIGRKWICFNDAQIVSLDVDTRVLSTGWKWATSKIDTLHEHPDDFATYLSDRRESEHKIDINPAQYPMVESLSKKEIIFTNEQEIKDLESWLQQIKEWKKFAIWDLQWDPFKISRQFKKLGNRLVFTAVDWTNEVFEEDISTKFPTIMSEKNQKKFIDFMNDKDNWMWWSAITNH